MRLAAIIVAGLLSRAVHTGWPIFDKYLGDALYAAMIHEIVRVTAKPSRGLCAVIAMAIIVAIECFQLTLIPARLAGSSEILFRAVGRLLGTQFSWFDMAAYAIGISAAVLVDNRDPVPVNR